MSGASRNGPPALKIEDLKKTYKNGVLAQEEEYFEDGSRKSVRKTD